MHTLFIITSTLNCEEKIENCISSVLRIRKSVKSVILHHLIADGGSKDKTLSIIEPYIGEDLTLVSTKDSGIYDAWNKCILYANSKCKGDFWFNFLGADDYFLDGFIYYLNFIFSTNNRTINLYSANSFFDGFKNDIVFGKSLNKKRLLHSMQISNSTAIYKHDLFSKDLFDCSYKICGDYDFIIRNQKKINSKYINCTVTFVRKGGVSTKYKGEAQKESLRSRIEYYRFNPLNIIIIYVLFFSKLIKDFLRKVL